MSSDVEIDYGFVDDNGVNINHFFVPPENRREGIGTKKMKELLSEFKEKDKAYVVVNMSGGENSVEFLKKFDFEIIESLDDNHVTAKKELNEN